MIIGVISDVHANVLALEAALGAMRGAGAAEIYCLGDLVGYGPAPNETLELLREEGVHCSLGTSDERAAFGFKGSDPPRSGVADVTLEWTRAELTPANLEYLRSLPRHRRVESPAGRIRLGHNHPEWPGENLDLAGDAQRLGEMLLRIRSQLLAVGGSHVPYTRELTEGLLLNPGSVGLTLNGEPGADYAVIAALPEQPTVKLGKVDYDIGSVCRLVKEKGLPPVIAETLERGQLPSWGQSR